MDGESDRDRTQSDESGGAPYFRLIFSAVVALTILALVLNVILAIVCPDSDQLKSVAETCSTTYKMGFGAMVGLLGGKPR